MKRKSARAALLLCVALVGSLLAACSQATNAGQSTAGADRGTITIAGSTALLPLVKDASGAYQALHATVKISVSGGGSATGITQVAAKAIDVGDSDITAPPGLGLVDHRVAVVAFAIVANPATGVKGLSRKQLRDVFAGNVSNWKDVGGADEKVVIVNRPRSSGTRAVFAKTIMGGVAISEGGLVEDATGTAVSVVKQTPGAVSYVALSGITGGGLSIVPVDGVAPTPETIEQGRYPIWSYEHMFTAATPPAEVAAFIAFVSARTDLVRKNAFIPIGSMKVREDDR